MKLRLPDCGSDHSHHYGALLLPSPKIPYKPHYLHFKFSIDKTRNYNKKWTTIEISKKPYQQQQR
eukprot:5297846-Amphidinium_carterae.2